MLRTTSVLALAVAAVGLSAPTMALDVNGYGQVDNQNYNIQVNIEVAPEVSMWAGNGHHDAVGNTITLLMNGAPGGNNAAATESSVTHINNVAADIDVAVSGDLPTPNVLGGGILFYIFKNGETQAQAMTAINAAPYGPAGALVWQDGDEGDSQVFATNLASTNSALTKVVTYGSASPGELPDVDTHTLDVLWTISVH
jgi:hypothetical protein